MVRPGHLLQLRHRVRRCSGNARASSVTKGWTPEGAPVGAGDLAAQVEQAYRNLAAALAGVGAGFEHVAKLTVYVVDWHPDMMGALIAGAVRAAEDLGLDIVRPVTLIGVAALGEPDLLVEVEAVAVIE